MDESTVYWAVRGKLHAAPLDGKGDEREVAEMRPKKLLLRGGYFYWSSEQGDAMNVQRMRVDGTHPVSILKNVSAFTDFEVDDDRLYWLTNKPGALSSALLPKDTDAIPPSPGTPAPAGKLRAAQILVSWLGAAGSNQIRSRTAARARIEEVKKRIDDGEDFTGLALAYDDDAARFRGGYLGTFARGTFPKPFEDAVAAAQPGAATAIVETRFGFHIAERIP